MSFSVGFSPKKRFSRLLGKKSDTQVSKVSNLINLFERGRVHPSPICKRKAKKENGRATACGSPSQSNCDITSDKPPQTPLPDNLIVSADSYTPLKQKLKRNRLAANHLLKFPSAKKNRLESERKGENEFQGDSNVIENCALLPHATTSPITCTSASKSSQGGDSKNYLLNCNLDCSVTSTPLKTPKSKRTRLTKTDSIRQTANYLIKLSSTKKKRKMKNVQNISKENKKRHHSTDLAALTASPILSKHLNKMFTVKDNDKTIDVPVLRLESQEPKSEEGQSS